MMYEKHVVFKVNMYVHDKDDITFKVNDRF